MKSVIVTLASLGVVTFVLVKNLQDKRKRELKESFNKIIKLCKDEYYECKCECELVNDLPTTPEPSPECHSTMLLGNSTCSSRGSFTLINEQKTS